MNAQVELHRDTVFWNLNRIECEVNPKNLQRFLEIMDLIQDISTQSAIDTVQTLEKVSIVRNNEDHLFHITSSDDEIEKVTEDDLIKRAIDLPKISGRRYVGR